jgi:hypothetical protein
MGDENPTLKFDTGTLSAVALRLSEHADATLARRDVQSDLRLAAAACDRFSTLQFNVAAIAQKAIDNPGWDNASLARDLRAALLVATTEEG